MQSIRLQPRKTAPAVLRPLCRLVFAAATLGLVVACANEPAPPTASIQAGDAHAMHARGVEERLTPDQRKAIANVRNATARFHDIEVARKAGYTEQYPPGCAVSPNAEGAQAFHYLNPGLVDGNVELLRPELLMYEPKADGSLQLIGVDYVVPLGASASAPTLLGVKFMENKPLDVWALHIWAWRPNPSGMFAAWNPKVSCEYAR
jgi:hypothetical protein